jgi:hypothetical protein
MSSQLRKREMNTGRQNRLPIESLEHHEGREGHEADNGDGMKSQKIFSSFVFFVRFVVLSFSFSCGFAALVPAVNLPSR